MNTFSKQSAWPALITAVVIAAIPQSANAISAEQYFGDGNRLARDQLHWAALMRYQQAAEQGMESPLLHYNIGVTHYHAGQHERANEELLRALDNPRLVTVTHYNLGLNAYAQGDNEAALRWFRLARDQQEDKKIRSFAVVAISRIRDEQSVPDEIEVRIEEQVERRPLGEFEFRATVGFGQDSNVFRAPAEPYLDRSEVGDPVVTPVLQSASYTPLSLSAKYRLNNFDFEGFFVSYRLAGRYYNDEAFENGNEYQQEIGFGSDFSREEDGRTRELKSAFRISQHHETYVDHDDGDARTVGGVMVDDRLDYLRYGPELSLRQAHERFAFGAKLKGQKWNYEEQSMLPEYDHDFFSVSLYSQFKFTPSSLLRVTAEGYSRRYGDRPGYDLDGQPRDGNPDMHYDYYALKLTARQRIFDDLWFGFDIARTERVDQYAGYNDYTRDHVAAELHWTPSERFDVEAHASYYLYDYPNAYAFHNPLAARKTQEAIDAGVTASFQVTRRISLVAIANFRETVSTDARIQYERSQYSLGFRWQQ